MGRCNICGKVAITVAKVLGACVDCIRNRFEEAEPLIRQAHAESRKQFGLPITPPKDPDGIQCKVCVHECCVKVGGLGYCGLPLGDRTRARVSWYYDPLPTNCVADFVCPGGTGCGYPKWAYRSSPEWGWKNLAVFYEACSFDCLYCQNWNYRLTTGYTPRVTPSELGRAVDYKTACICFFGGDPTPQLSHSLASARQALKEHEGRIMRVCWETNGCMSAPLRDEMVELALRTGGCIKFDLKAWDNHIHYALTGVSNTRTLENFAAVAHHAKTRPEVPLIVASTLLVPGYVDEKEVYRIARFIADCDPNIPYVLLAFAPEFMMSDLPHTSSSHARRALIAAKEAGLRRIRLGNQHLLWEGDYNEIR